jgi:streptomycin 6-kinase
MPWGVPYGFSNTILELHGEDGAVWLGRLPGLLSHTQKRWSLKLGAPFYNLTYNYVIPATGPGGVKLVLKAGYPCPELCSEIEALQHFDGQGVVQLVKADPDIGLLLLEALIPGIPLTSLGNDEQATSVAAGLMRQIRRPVPGEHNFRTVTDWLTGFERLRSHFKGGYGPFPPRLVEQAKALFAELLASTQQVMLLHGDLHHTNILTAGRQPWLAIDPKGVIGEPAYEASAFMYNPVPQLLKADNPGIILQRRLDQFSHELDLDRFRLAGWAFSQAVLSAWWSYEDHGRGWEYFIACAELLERLF